MNFPRPVEFSITLQSKRDVLQGKPEQRRKVAGEKVEEGLLQKLRRDDHEDDPYPKSVSRVLEWETLLGREGGTQLELLTISPMDELKVCHLRLEGNRNGDDQDPGGRSTFDLPIRFVRSGERLLGRLRRSWRRFLGLDRENCARQMNCVQPTELGRKLVDLGFGRGGLCHNDCGCDYHSDEGEGDKQIMHGVNLLCGSSELFHSLIIDLIGFFLNPTKTATVIKWVLPNYPPSCYVAWLRFFPYQFPWVARSLLLWLRHLATIQVRYPSWIAQVQQ
jgi:hypothetical protein